MKWAWKLSESAPYLSKRGKMSATPDKLKKPNDKRNCNQKKISVIKVRKNLRKIDDEDNWQEPRNGASLSVKLWRV